MWASLMAGSASSRVSVASTASAVRARNTSSRAPEGQATVRVVRVMSYPPVGRRDGFARSIPPVLRCRGPIVSAEHPHMKSPALHLPLLLAIVLAAPLPGRAADAPLDGLEES